MTTFTTTIKSKINLFLRMRFKYQLWFIFNFIACGIARAAILTLPLPRLRPYFGQFHKTVVLSTLISKKQQRQAQLIGKSVRLAAKYTPWNSSCLTQAMVAKFWCRLYRIPYILYIGFAKSPDEPSGYKAHAWIAAGPVAITGGNGLVDYHVVSSYIYFRDIQA